MKKLFWIFLYYIDYRDSRLQLYNVDVFFKFDDNTGQWKFKRPSDPYSNISDGDTLKIWIICNLGSQTTSGFQPTNPTNLTISIQNNHPKLSWTRSEPTESAKYDAYRSTSEEGTYYKQNAEPITDDFWIDYDIRTDLTPKTTYYYKVRAISGDESKSSPGYSNIESIEGKCVPQKQIPKTSRELSQQWSLNCYPNPFNPSTNIEFSLPVQCKVTLSVFDLLGKEVQNLIDEDIQAGYYQVKFYGSNLSSGIYFFHFKAISLEADKPGYFSQTKKIIFSK